MFRGSKKLNYFKKIGVSKCKATFASTDLFYNKGDAIMKGI
jgi:hypothetical protein